MNGTSDDSMVELLLHVRDVSTNGYVVVALGEGRAVSVRGPWPTEDEARAAMERMQSRDGSGFAYRVRPLWKGEEG